MQRRLRSHLTFANITSATALFLVLAGGTAVATGHLGTNVIRSRNIVPGAVHTSDLADHSVTNAKLASGAVGSNSIAAGAVGMSQLAAGSVGAAQLAPGSVGSDQLGEGAVTSGKIADNSVSAAKIPNAANGSDEVNAEFLDGIPSADLQLGDGANQVLQAAPLSFGEESSELVIASGIISLACSATPTLNFKDFAGDSFETDAWEPSHLTIPDGGSHSFSLPTDGMAQIEIFGAGGDLIVTSSYVNVSDSSCTMVANAISNFSAILGTTAGESSRRSAAQRAQRQLRGSG